jgi:hypothetical protein
VVSARLQAGVTVMEPRVPPENMQEGVTVMLPGIVPGTVQVVTHEAVALILNKLGPDGQANAPIISS